MRDLIDMLAKLGSIAIDGQAMRDRDYLERNGWICLGQHATSGQIHWTMLERGIGEGGPVTFQRAIWLQKTKDATARNAAAAPPQASAEGDGMAGVRSVNKSAASGEDASNPLTGKESLNEQP